MTASTTSVLRPDRTGPDDAVDDREDFLGFEVGCVLAVLAFDPDDAKLGNPERFQRPADPAHVLPADGIAIRPQDDLQVSQPVQNAILGDRACSADGSDRLEPGFPDGIGSLLAFGQDAGLRGVDVHAGNVQ